MGRKGKGRGNGTELVNDYRHEEAQRKNNPPAGISPSYEVKERKRVAYSYDPHLDPQLIWAGKAEHTSFEVDLVSLHIHERISTKAILRAVQRPQPLQLSLFADPELPLDKQIEFYQHDVNWANRLILGDSLLVMNSLLVKEGMRGKVQMIYVDPPYGIKYSSNFQPRIDRRDVKDTDEDLTREPEQIKAYRDTWKLGIHSYLTYLRDRLLLCRELLTESGSIFVQMNDENLHLVRCLMDEVFGRENFVAVIMFKTAVSQNTATIPRLYDFLLWYSRSVANLKVHRLYRDRAPEELESTFRFVDDNGYRFKDAQLKAKTELEASRLAFANRLVKIHGQLCAKRYPEDTPITSIDNVWDDTVIGTYQSMREKVYAVQTNTKVIERCILMTTDPGDLVFDPTCGSGTTAYCAEKWGRRWITWDTSRVALAIARQRLMTAKFDYYELAHPEKGVSHGFVYETVPHITLESIAKNTEIDAIAEKYQPRWQELLGKLSKALGKEVKEWEVPRGSPPEEWTAEAKALWAEFDNLRQKRQKEIDESIQRNAPQEVLYDRPRIKRGVVRVTGPFTVEAIPVPAVEAPQETPIPSFEEDEARRRISNRAGDFIDNMIELLRKDGITFPGGKKMLLEGLHPVNIGFIHAEGEVSQNGKSLRAAVSFGPQYGPVTASQVMEAIRTAITNAYDMLIFAGFSFDPEAQAFVQKTPVKGLSVHFANMAPDILVGDLLKPTRSSQLFTVFGEPDIKVERQKDNTYIVSLLGVDIYDPVSGNLSQVRGEDVAAWFLDTDYDGMTFHICQAFFPGGQNAWEKLQRALKATIPLEAFERMRGTASFPFEPGEHSRIAVKVIDFRGNEVMKVASLGNLSYDTQRRRVE